MLRLNGVIAYRLPAYTSGRLQPLNAGIFSPFKTHLRNLIQRSSTCSEDSIFDQIDLLKLMKKAFELEFTRHKIMRAFCKERLDRVRFEEKCLQFRVRPYGVPNVMPRSL